MPDDFASVTQRLPVALVKEIDDEAKARTDALGMTVNRTAVIRSILTDYFRGKEARACTAPEIQTPK